MAFAPIGRLIPGAARRAGMTRDLAITAALQACQQALARLFPDGASKYAEPVSVRADGGLVVSCRSPGVAQTIRLHEREVLDAVHAAAPMLRIARCFLVPRSREDLREVERVQPDPDAPLP